jgi:hypothetical protein
VLLREKSYEEARGDGNVGWTSERAEGDRRRHQGRRRLVKRDYPCSNLLFLLFRLSGREKEEGERGGRAHKYLRMRGGERNGGREKREGTVEAGLIAVFGFRADVPTAAHGLQQQWQNGRIL